MYIVLVILANGDRMWRTYSKEEHAIAYAKVWNKRYESAQVYKLDNTTPIYNS